jgi:hypothetical protein
MPTQALVCWKCAASLDEVPLPIARYAECLACRCELHVCRMCRFYDAALAQDCGEPMAEEVKDKTRANFCEFFEPRPQAYTPENEAGKGPDLDALDALFGGEGPGAARKPSADDGIRALEDLFGTKPERKD